MKKIISAVLALVMVLSMFTVVSAATVESYMTGRNIPNPMPVNLTIEVAAGRNGSGTYSTDNLAITSSGAEGVDYKTTLVMAPIRELFGKNFIRTAFGGDTAADTEFKAGLVTTTVDVTVTYPAGAIFAEGVDIALDTVGHLDAGDIFGEVSRMPGTNSVTIRFANTTPLTVESIMADVNNKLKDITFILDDVVSYASEGTYSVTVSLTGSTTIDFTTSADFVANYSGTDTHNTIYTAITQGGNPATSSYIVTFNTNGGSEVKAVKVSRGDKVTAPAVTKEGYVFDGWYADSAFTVPFDFDKAITKDITIYAKWTEETKPVDPTPDVPKAPEDFDKFTDLGGYEWAETAINYLAYKDVIKGVTETTYEPNWGIKRGEVALLMVRIFGLTSESTDEFDDIELDYYRDACRIGKAHGVLLGINEDNTLYEPERIILREEMAALVVRSLVTMGHIDDPTDADTSMYVDADDIEAYAVPYVAYLTRMGVVQGDPDEEFRPKDTITRAEAAQILYNLYKLDIEGLLD